MAEDEKQQNEADDWKKKMKPPQNSVTLAFSVIESGYQGSNKAILAIQEQLLNGNTFSVKYDLSGVTDNPEDAGKVLLKASTESNCTLSGELTIICTWADGPSLFGGGDEKVDATVFGQTVSVGVDTEVGCLIAGYMKKPYGMGYFLRAYLGISSGSDGLVVTNLPPDNK